MTGEPRCLGTFVGSNAGFCVSVAMGMRPTTDSPETAMYSTGARNSATA